MTKTIIEQLFAWGPVWFGIGFMAPVLMTLMQKAAWSPFGLPPLIVGLMIGVIWGTVAKLRGTWI